MKYQQRIEDAWQRDLHKKSCNECSRRKFYQEGFRDGQKTMDWIPTDKKNPEDIEQFRNFKVINVLITTKNGRVTKGQRFLDYKGNWCWGRKLSPIAWALLPEPYRKENL